jgi:hypothetical protein
MEHKNRHKEHHHESKHEHKPKEGMQDNRMVKDGHREGISRVMQKGHNPLDYEGHFGGMKGGWKHGWSEDHHKDGSHKPDHFKRPSGPLTPRKA